MYIGESAFEECEALEEAELPDSVQIVEQYAFAICPALRRARIPEGCTKWGTNMFAYSGLEEITIPAGTKMLYEGERLLCSEQLIDTSEMYEEEVEAIRLKRAAITGEITEKLNLTCLEGRQIEQLVFTANPPEEWEVPFTAEDGVTVYYLKEHAGEWAPNGEMEWKGFPIVGIDSLDDLPPVA